MDSLDIIDHVALCVNDIEKAIAWYKKNTQCKIIYQDASWGLIKFANIFIALVLPGNHPPHIAISCDHLEKYGAPQMHRDGTRFVYIEDPFGNVIEMIDGLHHHDLEKKDD